MRIKLNRAANQVIKKKIWRDSQIKAIEADLSELEDIIRANWDTVGYINKETLYSAENHINKHMNLRDKKIIFLKDWIQEINILDDERAAFASCLR